MSLAKFYCNRLTTVQEVQYYESLIFGAHHTLCPKKVVHQTHGDNFVNS